MKLFASAFIVLAAAAANAQQENRVLATLADKWNIKDPAFTQSGLSMDFVYDLSNFITSGQAYYEVYTSGCKESGTEVTSGLTMSALTDIDPALTSVTDDASFVIDERSATVPVSIDVATIAAATDIYTEAGTGDALGATITFCIRFGLNTLGGTPTEVNFLESVVTMDVDLGDGFSIANINVTPKDQLINTASQDYTVTGFLCTPGTGLIVGDPAAAFNQGALVTVCVEPDATGKADGIKMRTIDDFTWTRDSTTQEAIAASAASTNSLTSFNPATCAGGDYCEFSSILFAAFYATTGSVAGSGTATMQFGATRRRRLQEGRALRTLQDEIAASSPIDLDVNLAAADDGPSALQTAAGASMGTMCAAVVASIGAIALL